MTISEIQNEIIEEFSMFDDWDERFQYVIDLGKNLPLIADNLKVDDNTITGCQSKVWLFGEKKSDEIISVENLQKGFYFVKFSNAERTFTKKISIN